MLYKILFSFRGWGLEGFRLSDSGLNFWVSVRLGTTGLENYGTGRLLFNFQPFKTTKTRTFLGIKIMI